ncbi:hypothetical protein P9112_001532 [Eukaryota sp. TZLM1-RC]
MVNLGRVLTRSTATQDVRSPSQQLSTFSISSTSPADRISYWVVTTYVSESVGITSIRDRLLRIWSSPSHYSSKGHTLGEFFSVLQIEYENFCYARFYMEQVNHVDFSYQNQITHQHQKNVNLTADALIWKVCASFGIPFQRHSDNGPGFFKAVFDELSKFLGIEVSKSIPRLSDFIKILEIIERSTSESTFIQEIQSQFRRLKEKQEKAVHHQASKASKLIRSTTPNPFDVGQLVLRASCSSAKLHGDYLGPFLITDIVSNSSVKIKNLCTSTIVQASVKHLTPWRSSLPANDEFLLWVAASNVEKHIIKRYSARTLIIAKCNGLEKRSPPNICLLSEILPRIKTLSRARQHVVVLNMLLPRNVPN